MEGCSSSVGDGRAKGGARRMREREERKENKETTYVHRRYVIAKPLVSAVRFLLEKESSISDDVGKIVHYISR